jgi:hypothetical protein
MRTYIYTHNHTYIHITNTRYHLSDYSGGGRSSIRTCQELYNYTHSSIRTKIERAFGELKGKFRVLRTGLYLKDPELYPLYIKSIVCIFNFIKMNKTKYENLYLNNVNNYPNNTHRVLPDWLQVDLFDDAESEDEELEEEEEDEDEDEDDDNGSGRGILPFNLYNDDDIRIPAMYANVSSGRMTRVSIRMMEQLMIDMWNLYCERSGINE